MPVYLDHAATTPLRAEVLAAMLPYLREEWGNPSSLHGPGRRAARAVQDSRQTMAEILNCAPEEVVFTASGSEEAWTLKRRWTALETLLTFWPPAPCARTAVISSSLSGTIGTAGV